MTDLINALGINWSALLAQVINFGILIFLLAKFVYKPVLRVIDERRAVAEKTAAQAEELERFKKQLEADRNAILRKADVEAGSLMERAKLEAEAVRTEIEKAARERSQQIVAKGMQQLENERSRVGREVQDKLARAIVVSAEKILRREFSKEDQKNFEEELKQNLPNLLA